MLATQICTAMKGFGLQQINCSGKCNTSLMHYVLLVHPILLIYSSIRQAFYNLWDKHVMIYSLLGSCSVSWKPTRNKKAIFVHINRLFRPPLSSVYLLVVYKALQLKSQRLGQLWLIFLSRAWSTRHNKSKGCLELPWAEHLMAAN